MKVYIACLTTFIVVAASACGSQRGETEVGSRQDPLSRKAASGDIEPTVDDGTGGHAPGRPAAIGDLTEPDAGDAAVAVPPACPPQRWDLVLGAGRKCSDFAGRHGNGTWTAASTIPGAPPSLSETHCALTFVPDAPACLAGSVTDVVTLTCAERHTVTERSALCAANPAECNVAPLAEAGATKPFAPEDFCTSIIPKILPDGGNVGYAGGCSSCGVVYDNTLYITNPIDQPTIATSVTTSEGIVVPLHFNGVAKTTFAVPLSGNYQPGTVSIW